MWDMQTHAFAQEHTRLHKSTRVCHLSCSWFVLYLMQELYNKLIFRMCPCMLEKYSRLEGVVEANDSIIMCSV